MASKDAIYLVQAIDVGTFIMIREMAHGRNLLWLYEGCQRR